MCLWLFVKCLQYYNNVLYEWKIVCIHCFHWIIDFFCFNKRSYSYILLNTLIKVSKINRISFLSSILNMYAHRRHSTHCQKHMSKTELCFFYIHQLYVTQSTVLHIRLLLVFGKLVGSSWDKDLRITGSSKLVKIMYYLIGFVNKKTYDCKHSVNFCCWAYPV